MEQTDKYIYKLEEGDVEDLAAGWYFTDETEDFVGPYLSRQEAIDMMNKYAKEVLGI